LPHIAAFVATLALPWFVLVEDEAKRLALAANFDRRRFERLAIIIGVRGFAWFRKHRSRQPAAGGQLHLGVEFALPAAVAADAIVRTHVDGQTKATVSRRHDDTAESVDPFAGKA